MAQTKLRSRLEVTTARYLRARDGDTIEVLVNVGFGIWRETTIRICGIESWEPMGIERDRATETAAWLDAKLAGADLIVYPRQGGFDKYGRLRADVHVGDANLADVLVEAGKAWRVPLNYTHAAPLTKPLSHPSIVPFRASCGILETRT